MTEYKQILPVLRASGLHKGEISAVAAHCALDPVPPASEICLLQGVQSGARGLVRLPAVAPT